MARKKVDPLEEALPATNKVRVRTVREYVEDQREPLEPDQVEGDDEVDPLTAFAGIIEPTDQYTLRIWRLPNYDVDGRVSAHGTNREFCGSIPYRAEDDTLLDRIKDKVPLGGWVLLELIQRGAFVSQGVIKVSASAQPTVTQNQQGQPVVVNMPGQPAPVIQAAAPVVDPLVQMEKQTDYLLKTIEIVERLRPAPQPTVVNGTGDISSNPQFVEVQTRVAMMDKLLSLSGTNPSLAEKLLGKVLGADNEEKQGSSWVDLGIALLNQGPAIIQSIAQNMPRFVAAAPPNGGAGYPSQASGSPITGTALPPASAQPAQEMDPLTQRWQQVVRRIVEDCAAGEDLDSATNAVSSLYAQEPQTREMIDKLVGAQPGEVIQLCAMTAKTQQEFDWIIGLGRYSTNLKWIKDLQAELKGDLAQVKVEMEQQQEQSGEQGESDES